MNVLIVQDDHATAEAMQAMLVAEGHSFCSTGQGREAVRMAALADYDVILLDESLPDAAGVDVVRALRAQGVESSVILIGAPAGPAEERVRALDLGADYTLAPPFMPNVWMALIRAAARRYRCAFDGATFDSPSNIVVSGA
jgi:two-component system cell cycle response regulator CtrA